MSRPGGRGQLTEPARTITARRQHGALVHALVMQYYSGARQTQTCREPAPTVVSRGRIELVTVNRELYQIADIGIRMLVARELFRTQGFPESYIIDLHNDAIRHHHRAGPVEGVRALVHGHRPLVEVERTGNRWNIDTGAGIPQLNRLSILELGPELRSWTFDVDETRTCQTAQVEEDERHSRETA